MIGLAIAGCGDGSSTDDYVAEADAICSRADVRLDALAGPESAQDALLALDEAAPVLQERLDRLGRLDPPALARPAHDAGMRALADQLTVIADATRRRRAGEPTREVFGDVRARLSQIEPRIQGWRREAGLRVCGGGPILAVAVRPPGELLPPGLPDRPPSGERDESPARTAFRRTFEEACGRELDSAICRCAADRVAAAYRDDARYFAFARSLERGAPAARAEAAEYIEDCLAAG